MAIFPLHSYPLTTAHSLQMRELGFDGYAIDFIDCPQAMRGFLMRECQLHRTVRPASSSYELY